MERIAGNGVVHSIARPRPPRWDHATARRAATGRCPAGCEDGTVTDQSVGPPRWADPRLNELAAGLRDAHREVATLPAAVRPRLTRHLLVITDLAKRDPELAARRLRAFRAGLDAAERS